MAPVDDWAVPTGGSRRWAWGVKAAVLLASVVAGEAQAAESCETQAAPACVFALAVTDARLVEDTPRRALLLVRAGIVAGALGRGASEEMVNEGMQAALGMEDAGARAATLLDIAIMLDHGGMDATAARGELEAAVGQLPEATERERLRAELREAAKAVPLTMADGKIPAPVEVALPASSPWRQGQAVLRLIADDDVAAARRLARSIDHPGWRADALAAILAHTVLAADPEAVLDATGEAMAATAAIADHDWRASVRMDIALALPAGF